MDNISKQESNFIDIVHILWSMAVLNNCLTKLFNFYNISTSVHIEYFFIYF